MMVQVEGHSDCMKVLFPGCRDFYEFDHSGCHAVKKVEDEPQIRRSTAAVRDSVMTTGPRTAPAVVMVDGQEQDLKLKVGDTQVCGELRLTPGV